MAGNQCENESFTVQLLIDEFHEELKNMSGKCMDIGCGDGHETRNLLLPALYPNAEIIGTDLLESLIEYATKTHVDEKRLKFHVLDIESKHLDEKYISKYDHIFSSYTLHWCNDIRQVFENMYQLLRPGGILLLSMVQRHNILEVMSKMSKDIRYSPYIKDKEKFIPPFYNSICPAKELKMLLRDTGFKVHHCSLRDRAISTQMANRLPGVIMSFSQAYMENMPCKLMEQFKDELTLEFGKRRIQHTISRNEEQKDISDVHQIFIVYAQKT